MAKQTTSRSASSGSSKRSSTYKSAGTLADGVTVLSPKSRPSHFTAREIKSTIQEIRRNTNSRQFLEVDGAARRG